MASPRPRARRPRKNAAAVALARARWAGVSAAERTKGARKAVNARWERARAAREEEGKA
jgi:hypothetical protein